MVPVNQNVGTVKTGSDGLFMIEGVDWPEDAWIIVQAKNKKGDYEGNVELDTIA